MTGESPAGPSLATVFVRSESVVARTIADECILVPLARGGANLDAIYELNPVGAFIWERLDGIRPGEAIVAALTEGFDVEESRATADYLEFVGTLAAIGAIRSRDAVAG